MAGSLTGGVGAEATSYGWNNSPLRARPPPPWDGGLVSDALELTFIELSNETEDQIAHWDSEWAHRV